MHRLSNRPNIRRFRIVAMLVVIKWLLIPCILGLLVRALWQARSDLMLYAIGLAVFASIISVAIWIISMPARCPLCLVPPFSHQQCSKHRGARHLLGSYRIFVAVSILFKGCFRCPYCGEMTAVGVRNRDSKSRGPTGKLISPRYGIRR